MEARHAVPDGHTRAVLVVFTGFPVFTHEPRRVCWDNTRLAVRTATGRLRWYEDSTVYAFRDENDEVRSVEKGEAPSYPRHYREKSREMDAVALLSLADLLEVADLGKIELVTPEDVVPLHFLGDPGNAARVQLSEESGVVLRADGVEMGNAWHIEVLEEALTAGDRSLRIADVS